ncbi:hypothetical protein HanRHA438_Chr04g0167661 [Helianthus annuus]|nr:hypothetical protein HanHA89_Chr04g0142531 [Helianthus annuus]KAJ0757076.1 hypothetical protein HanLR1_Chr04g0134441 [Helianthus annuus]KAJ0760810.1 hypothetical protein HanOQP8_Chr04g0142301 [Helianthus annuus]KAJ0926142.1 hypothetical protein HanRHA438_Chr04g0167661 [Helianthus annuus]KAJ0930636.1 hypothetical protein HanPSC8_Chr04g0151671 [Helianthus annuus]
MVHGGLPPGEVRHQKDRRYDNLYRFHVYAQANCASTSYQITREWRTMYRERAEWEKHSERLAAEAKLFEKAKADLAKKKADFEKEKKLEEWGLQGVKLKLSESKDTLAKDRCKWRVASERENQRMFAARTEITNLKARVEELTKSEEDFKERYEEAKSHRERVENKSSSLTIRTWLARSLRLLSSNVTCVSHNKRLRLKSKKGESLEIDLTTERVKAKSAEEARKVCRAALNVAQDNYSEVQSIVEPLINNLDWLQNYGIAHIANSILNSAELYRVVVALTVAYRAVGHRAGYVECAAHVDTALATH